MSDYTFPFDTCEKPNKNGIAQPYSALFIQVKILNRTPKGCLFKIVTDIRPLQNKSVRI